MYWIASENISSRKNRTSKRWRGLLSKLPHMSDASKILPIETNLSKGLRESHVRLRFGIVPVHKSRLGDFAVVCYSIQIRQKALPTRHEVARPLSLSGVSLSFCLARIELGKGFCQSIPNRLKQDRPVSRFFSTKRSRRRNRGSAALRPPQGVQKRRSPALQHRAKSIERKWYVDAYFFLA